MPENQICQYSKNCSGCSLWPVPIESQRKEKETQFLSSLSQFNLSAPNELSWANLPSSRLRERLDFQWSQDLNGSKFGLWDKNKKEILDLADCQQLTPELELWLKDFRKIKKPDFIKRGSVRLRVHSQKDQDPIRGVWLDLSNENIRDLLLENNYLAQLNNIALIEIGQKRKRLVPYSTHAEQENRSLQKNWSLSDKFTLSPWIKITFSKNKIDSNSSDFFDLNCRIADFTQVGSLSNIQITQKILQLLVPNQEVIEFGSGIGNLTLPIASLSHRVTACESDSFAIESLNFNHKKFEEKFSITLPIQTIRADFQKRAISEFASNKTKIAVVNPPRSGTGDFLIDIESTQIENLIYMSCYPESFLSDIQKSIPNWKLKKVVLVDQFPQTMHLEIISLWQR